jgi:hypothetical protein
MDPLVATTANNAVGGNLLSFNFNPTNPKLLSCSQYAALYQNYEVLDFRVEFASSNSFTMNGSIGVFFDADAADKDADGRKLVAQMMSQNSGAIVPITQAKYDWHYKAKEASGGKKFYCAITADTSDPNKRETYQFHFRVLVVDPIGNSGTLISQDTSIGSLVVRYKIRFYHRNIDGSLTHAHAGFLWTAPSTTDIFGVDSAPTVNSAWSTLVSKAEFTDTPFPLILPTVCKCTVTVKEQGTYLVGTNCTQGLGYPTAGGIASLTIAPLTSCGVKGFTGSTSTNFARGESVLDCTSDTKGLETAALSSWAVVETTATDATFYVGLTSTQTGNITYKSDAADAYRAFCCVIVPIGWSTSAPNDTVVELARLRREVSWLRSRVVSAALVSSSAKTDAPDQARRESRKSQQGLPAPPSGKVDAASVKAAVDIADGKALTPYWQAALEKIRGELDSKYNSLSKRVDSVSGDDVVLVATVPSTTPQERGSSAVRSASAGPSTRVNVSFAPCGHPIIRGERSCTSSMCINASASGENKQ